MSGLEKLSILVPVFNEESTLEELINRLKNVDLSLEKEIIIVDDFSNDATREILKTLEGCKIFYHDKNQGKGSAVSTALSNATGDVIIIQDADLEYNPEEYKKVLEPILQGDAKVVYGSRMLSGENQKSFMFLQFWANKFLTWLTNFLFRSKLTDMETCYKAFTKDVLAGVKIKAKRFDLEPEITAKILKKGIEIKEVPISYKSRKHFEGKKITYKDGLHAIWTLVKYRLSNE